MSREWSKLVSPSQYLYRAYYNPQMAPAWLLSDTSAVLHSAIILTFILIVIHDLCLFPLLHPPLSGNILIVTIHNQFSLIVNWKGLLIHLFWTSSTHKRTNGHIWASNRPICKPDLNSQNMGTELNVCVPKKHFKMHKDLDWNLDIFLGQSFYVLMAHQDGFYNYLCAPIFLKTRPSSHK